MKAFKLGGLVWQRSEDVLSYRPPWWHYLVGALLSLVVLGFEARYVALLVQYPPTITVGGSRHSRGMEVAWKDQTPEQRKDAMRGRLLALVFPPTLLSLLFLTLGSVEQRNPMVFSKSGDQVRKGKRILANLSDVKCVAVVHWPHGLGMKNTGRATQVFIRFSKEPFSMLVDASSGIDAAEGAAKVLAAWLAVPIVYDPVVKVRPRKVGRGFPVVTGENAVKRSKTTR